MGPESLPSRTPVQVVRRGPKSRLHLCQPPSPSPLVTEAEAIKQEAIPQDDGGPLPRKVTACSTRIDRKLTDNVGIGF